MRRIFHPVLVFVLAQLAWLSLLGIWIYWYITNYIIFNTVGDKISPQIASKGTNIIALVMGLVFLVAILVGMYLIFIYLNKQINITKLYDNFIANITHELKSPLTSIQMYLETINTRDMPVEKQQEFIFLMLKDARRLKNLINSILEIAALDQKQIAYDYNVYHAESLIKNLLNDSCDYFKLPPDVIQIFGSASCHCVIDRNAFRIVINNLIDNAIKYTTNPVAITVNFENTSKNFIMNFKDQGIGIAPKDQGKIFNKFHRIYNKHIPNVKGTGLGLYQVKQIIKYHGGKVLVYSAGKNQGTTFRIELPIYQASKKRYLNYLLRLTRNLKHKRADESSI